MKKIVFFQGTFDIVNTGHIRAFELAKSYGDILVVGLNTDELVSRDKHEPYLPYSQRREIVEANENVDIVIPCDDEQALPYLKMLDADVFVLTKEWEERHRETGIRWMNEKGGEVVFSPRWDDIECSSDIRAEVIRRHEEGR